MAETGKPDDPGIITQLAAESSYGGYLQLGRLLSAQPTFSIRATSSSAPRRPYRP